MCNTVCYVVTSYSDPPVPQATTGKDSIGDFSEGGVSFLCLPEGPYARLFEST